MALAYRPEIVTMFEENSQNFQLKDCQFIVTLKAEDVNIDIFSRNGTDPDSTRKKEQFLDFGLFSRASNLIFQMVTLESAFEKVHFNQFSEQYLKVHFLV